MAILADTHVHLYPGYDRARLFNAASDTLTALISSDQRADTERVLCLTESQQHHGWATMKAEGRVGDWRVEPTSQAAGVRLIHPKRGALWVFAGRQIVTIERIEVLALFTDATFPDGLTARDSILEVYRAGGIPVLSWSPGKWFGARGEVVAKLIKTHTPDQLLLGDILLRPTVWLEPLLMRRARSAGFKVIAGTDPLPVAGEEDRVGRYASRAEFTLDPKDPVSSFRSALRDPAVPFKSKGRRNGPVECAVRFWRARTDRL